MEKKREVSEYAKYIVLADKSRCNLKGTYEAFINFKNVLNVVHGISNSDNTTYLHDGNIYTRKITSAEAFKIVKNLTDGIWSEHTWKMKLIAAQLKVRI